MTDLIRNAARSEIRAALADPTIQVGLFGPPGVGKTHDLFWAGSIPVLQTVAQNGTTTPRVITRKRYVGKIQCHTELSPAEVMGMYVPDGDKFRWEAGAADLAYQWGGMLILDEIDQASGPVKTYLQGLLDRGPGGTLSYVGRTFTQMPGYQAVATMNDWPSQGALQEALLDRFDAWFMVTRPSDEQLELLSPDLRTICEIEYSSAVDPMRGPDITFRMLLGIQKLRRIMPLEQAVLGATYNNTVLTGSLLEALALADPKDVIISYGVTAASAPVDPANADLPDPDVLVTPAAGDDEIVCTMCGDPHDDPDEPLCDDCHGRLNDEEPVAALARRDVVFASLDDGDDA